MYHQIPKNNKASKNESNPSKAKTETVQEVECKKAGVSRVASANKLNQTTEV